MTKDQVKAILERVPTWPEDRQRELAEIALEIEGELAGAGYDATPDELAAIDEGLAEKAASEEEITAAFAVFRPKSGANIRSGPLPTFAKLPPITPGPVLLRSGREANST